MRRSRRNCLWDSKIVYITRSALFGIGVTVLCLMGFSAIMTRFSASPMVVSMMANISLCVGCCVAGFMAAKKRRRYGIMTGIYCGAIIYCVVYFLGVVVLGRFISMSLLTKLLMAVVCSAIGGIFGVNTKIRRPPP
ncbi:MAG: TIGR04086 family membrane protein [Clostridiales bacterium]|nr:TIGR04086 family membrane protein [Clostridiales bacterium]